jgi:hypothetical protein
LEESLFGLTAPKDLCLAVKGYHFKVYLNKRLGWLIVLALTLLSVVSRLKFNGLILNFDYGIYQPDGSHYAYQTLTFLGVDSNVAANRVVEWYQVYGIKVKSIDPSLITPSNTEMWRLVSPRILYSILSVPFVHFMGLSGMMVIPVLSYILLVFSIYRLSENSNRPIIGLALVIAMTTSPTVSRWMIANITDSLLTGLFALTVLLIAKDYSRKTWTLSMVILICLTSATRFCLPIWFGISFVYFLNKMRTQGLVILLTSTFAFLPALLALPSVPLIPASTDTQELKKLLQIPISLIRIGFVEIAQLAVLDRLLLIILVAAVIMSIIYWREMASQFFLSVFLSVWLIGAINPVLGVNFRYQLPITGFACWAILSNLKSFTDWVAWRRIDVVGKKT